MKNKDENKNYYDVLELPTNVTQAEIHQGFLRAKNAYSGDSLALYSLMGEEDCSDLLVKIEEAYMILSDPKKRKEYDSAHNLNVDVSINDLTGSFSHTNYTEEMSLHSKTSSTTALSKKVASKKFNLTFDVNQELEEEIERTTEFTGDLLKRIRENRNVDLHRLSEMTKVSKTYLQNIENESLEGLPALVYVRGFVYQFAKCLKLNPDLVATSYLHRLKKIEQSS